jgi:hypothetical protein
MLTSFFCFVLGLRSFVRNSAARKANMPYLQRGEHPHQTLLFTFVVSQKTCLEKYFYGFWQVVLVIKSKISNSMVKWVLASVSQ